MRSSTSALCTPPAKASRRITSKHTSGTSYPKPPLKPGEDDLTADSAISALAKVTTPARSAQAQQEATEWWAAHHKGGN